jgi:hypothetical protein
MEENAIIWGLVTMSASVLMIMWEGTVRYPKENKGTRIEMSGNTMNFKM